MNDYSSKNRAPGIWLRRVIITQRYLYVEGCIATSLLNLQRAALLSSICVCSWYIHTLFIAGLICVCSVFLTTLLVFWLDMSLFSVWQCCSLDWNCDSQLYCLVSSTIIMSIVLSSRILISNHSRICVQMKADLAVWWITKASLD